MISNGMLKIYQDPTNYNVVNGLVVKINLLKHIGVIYTQITSTDYVKYIEKEYNVLYNESFTIDTKNCGKFNREHTHVDYEMQLVTYGVGKFCINVHNTIYELTVSANDFICIPAKTKHWFDAGPDLNFSAIRFFNSPKRWIARNTGSNISTEFKI